MTAMLDSDIIIEVLRSRNTALVTKWQALASFQIEISYSPITSAEVWAGARSSEFQDVSEFFAPLTCFPCDYEIGKLAGELMRRYTKSHRLELPDAIIAATAIKTGSQLWTRNRKHYPMPELTFFE